MPSTQHSASPSSQEQRPASPLLPSAPIGTFRLFRLLSLYPAPAIEVKVFSYPDPAAPRASRSPRDARLTPNERRASDDAYDISSGHCPPYDAVSYVWKPDAPPEPTSRTDPRDSPIEYFVRNEGSSTTPSQPITVHTYQDQPVTIHISDHLLYGLLTLQELHSPTWLFVDAICIDQADPVDKAVQVLGMDRVFGGAERVFIWLGTDLGLPGSSSGVRGMRDVLDMQDMNQVIHELPGANAEADAGADFDHGACLTYIPALADKLETYLSQRQRDQDHGAESTGLQVRDDSLTQPMASTEAFAVLASVPQTLWAALERLRFNPWFSRLWVLQEVALARDATLLYGQHSLPWPAYARFTRLCERIISGLFSRGYETDLVNQMYFAYNGRVSAIEKLKLEFQLVHPLDPSADFGSHETSEFTLIRLLIHNVRKCRCTLHIDRVYAILGLLSPRMRESIHVNYAPDMQDQYCNTWMEFFRVVLTFAPEVATDLFSNAAYLQRHPGLPSWCPNLMDNGEKKGLYAPGAGAGMPNGKPWKPYHVGQDSRDDNGLDLQTATPIPGTSNIRLLGLQIDEVQYVIDLSWISDSLQWSRLMTNQTETVPSNVARDLLTTFWKCLDHLRQLGNSTPEGDAILARCLTANSYNDEHPVNLEQLLDDYTSFMHCLEHYTWGPKSGGSPKPDNKTAGLRFGDRFQRLARKRAFFITLSGRAGLCSCNAQVGDILCALMNYRMPYLLKRKKEEEADDTKGQLFEMVGEAYVDGIMHGEAFVGRDMSTERPKEFIVC